MPWTSCYSICVMQLLLGKPSVARRAVMSSQVRAPLPGSVQFQKNQRASLLRERSRGNSDRNGSSGSTSGGVHNNEPELFRQDQRTPRSSPRSGQSASSSGKGGRSSSACRSVKGKASKTSRPDNGIATNSKKPKKSYGYQNGG